MSIATATLLADPPRRRHEEDDLQAQVVTYLRLALPDAVIHHSPGEGKRTKAAQAKLKRDGYCTGWPDIEIAWRSRTYFIELKAARGVLSAAQRETHRRLIYAGFDVMLCKSLPQVEAALRECGVHLRATVAA